jgi:tetratricopeptide (TPR) repeat protein
VDADRAAAGTGAGPDGPPRRRLPLVRPLDPVGYPPGPEAILAELTAVRGDADELLRQAPAQTDLDALDAAVERYGQAYHTLPDLLAAAVADFAEVQQALGLDTSPVRFRHGCRLLARLGTLTGLSLVALGERDEGLDWFGTARLAAKRTEDRPLEAWVVAMGTRPHLYGGSAQRAMATAREARGLGGARSPAVMLWALDSEAHAYALLGQHREARETLRRANAAFDRWHPHLAGTLYGYHERQLFWNTGIVYAFAGDLHRALPALDRARATVSEDSLLHALMRLDEAVALVTAGEISAGCRVAGLAVQGLPPGRRTGLVRYRLEQALAVVPPRYRTLGCVRELRTGAC